MLMTFVPKMRRIITPSSTKTRTPTPFAFGPWLEGRERIDRLRERNSTNDMIRNKYFEALKGITICTFGGPR